MGKTSNISLRIILAGLFILSGIGKLITLDSFETYVLDLNVLPEILSITTARLLIGIELVIGVLFISNLIPRITWLFTFLLMLGFTIFLFIQVISGVDENCNCFGNIIHLSPLASLIKNIVILALLFLLKIYHKEEVWQIKIGYIIPLVVLALIIPFILNPVISILSKHEDYPISELTKQSKTIEEKFLPSSDFNIYEGKKAVCFYSLRCVYCIKGAEKLSELADLYSFNENVLIYFVGNEENVDWFFDNAKSSPFKHRMIDKNELKIITKGKVPRILLVEDGIVKHTLRYNDIEDIKLRRFFDDY